MRRWRGAAALAVVAALASAARAEVPGALIVLETAPGTPGSDPAAAPPRFVLLKDGQVFVGGTSRVEAGRLEKSEAQALQKRAEALRKIPGIAGPVTLGGPAERTLRLRLLDREPLEIVATGLPSEASQHIRGGGADPVPATLAPLATLLSELLRFDHPSLRPYAPAWYALTVREATLVGGCRAWGFAFPIAEALAGTRPVSAAEAEGWPTGALPASVCADDRHYVVTLRPLLPSERLP